MASNITLVGARDRQLLEFLRIAGMNVSSIAVADLERVALSTDLSVDAFVIDLRNQEELPSALTVLKRQHPAVGIVVVASALDASLMLDAMRAGVNEWVSEPVTQVELKTAIDRVVQPRQSVAAAPVFAFVGAKGGVGTTTIAVNVATALRRLTSKKTLLVDLNLACG